MKSILKKRAQEVNFIFLKKTKGETILHWVVFAIFSVLAFTYVLPLLWLLVQSLHDPSLYQFLLLFEGPLALPEKLHFENYIDAFSMLKDNNVTFLGMFVNSMWYIVIAETWCTFWPVLVGYIFSKYQFKGRTLIYSLILFTMMVPLAGGTSGSFIKLIEALGIYDTGPLFVIVTGIGGLSGSLLVYLGIFNSIAWDYAESVFIDGGGHFTAFWRIMLPQAMPAIGALMIGSLAGFWNDYEQFLLYMPSTPTVASGIYKVSLTAGRFGAPLYYACLMFVTLPVLLIYAIFSEKIMKNLAVGGLKG